MLHAAIEHHHDGDRLHLIGEHRERLRLAVVVDLKHVAGQIGNQPAAGIGHGRIHGDRSYDILKRGLLKRPEARSRNRYTNRDECQPFHAIPLASRRVLHELAELAPRLLAGKFSALSADSGSGVLCAWRRIETPARRPADRCGRALMSRLRGNAEAHGRHHPGRYPAAGVGRRRAVPRPRRTPGLQRPAARYAKLEDFDGGFQFCRLVFRNGSNGDGAGWNVDLPRADENLSIRLSELSRTPVSMDENREPKTLLLNLRQPEVFHCPILMMTEPGGAYFDEEEVANLRKYLLKGGFLWADDFWGEYAWDYWESQIRARAAVRASIRSTTCRPITSLFHQMFTVKEFPQIPGIGYWDGADRTCERPDARQAHLRAINDDRGRIMVLMTHNTDFGDSYEQEAVDPAYFMKFSVPGYAFGINVLVYAMTH